DAPAARRPRRAAMGAAAGRTLRRGHRVVDGAGCAARRHPGRAEDQLPARRGPLRGRGAGRVARVGRRRAARPRRAGLGAAAAPRPPRHPAAGLTARAGGAHRRLHRGAREPAPRTRGRPRRPAPARGVRPLGGDGVGPRGAVGAGARRRRPARPSRHRPARGLRGGLRGPGGAAARRPQPGQPHPRRPRHAALARDRPEADGRRPRLRAVAGAQPGGRPLRPRRRPAACAAAAAGARVRDVAAGAAAGSGVGARADGGVGAVAAGHLAGRGHPAAGAGRAARGGGVGRRRRGRLRRVPTRHGPHRGQTDSMKLPTILRRASRATPSTTAAPQPRPRPVERPRAALRSPSRGPVHKVQRLPENHLRKDDSGDDAPRWMRRAAGISWRLLVILAVVVVLVYATARIQLVFVAVFLALVFTSVLRPLVNLLDRWIPRGLAVLASLLAAILVMGGIVTFVVQSVRGQWEDLSEEFSAGIQDLLSQLEHLPFGLSVTTEQIQEWIAQGEEWIRENQDRIIDQAATGAAEGAGSLFQGFAILALATFCTVFFLARGSQMWEWFVNQLPARVREKW